MLSKKSDRARENWSSRTVGFQKSWSRFGQENSWHCWRRLGYSATPALRNGPGDSDGVCIESHKFNLSRIEAGRREDRGAFSFYGLRVIDGSRGQVLVKEIPTGSRTSPG